MPNALYWLVLLCKKALHRITLNWELHTNATNYYVYRKTKDDTSWGTIVATLSGTTNQYIDTNVDSVAGGSTQLAVMPDGIYCMRAGDFDGNGIVSVTDLNFYNSQVLVNTYFPTDGNLDGNVTVADLNQYQPNASIIGVPQVRY